jgi:hypothetical protein
MTTSTTSHPDGLDYGTYHPLKSNTKDALPSLLDTAASIKSITIGCKNTRTLATFISSVNHLSELNVSEISGKPDKLSPNSKTLWRAILKHKDSLKSLIFGAPPKSACCSMQQDFVNEKGRMMYLPTKTRSRSVDQVEQLRDRFEQLEFVGVDILVEKIDILTGASSSSSSVISVEQSVQELSISSSSPATTLLLTLTSIQHIPSIKINIVIPGEETHFINDKKQVRSWDGTFTPGPLIQKTCADVAETLFSAFFKTGEEEKQQLKTLEVCFITVASWDRAQRYAVKSRVTVSKEKNGKLATKFVDKGRWVEWADGGSDKIA